MSRKRRPKASAWGVVWRGQRIEYFLRDLDYRPLWFKTRAAAMKYINETFGYIRHRPDLRKKPHYWRMPVAVRIEITLVSPRSGNT